MWLKGKNRHTDFIENVRWAFFFFFKISIKEPERKKKVFDDKCLPSVIVIFSLTLKWEYRHAAVLIRFELDVEMLPALVLCTYSASTCPLNNVYK